MSKTYVVLTAVGTDRPGLVDTVSDFVYAHKGNVESTRAATLGGEFAMILLVSGESASIEALAADAEGFAREAALAVTVKPTVEPAEGPVAEALPYELTVHAMDHPGIVRAVTHELASRGVNIRSLDTHVESAPHTGTDVFHFHARLDVPAQQKLPAFRAELEQLAESLNIDIQLTAAEA